MRFFLLLCLFVWIRCISLRYLGAIFNLSEESYNEMLITGGIKNVVRSVEEDAIYFALFFYFNLMFDVETIFSK